MNSLVASLTGRKNPLFSTLISLTLFGLLSQCRSLRPLENGKDEIPVCRCHDKDSVIITPARFDVTSGGCIGRDSLTFDEWRNVLGYGCKVPERIPPCDSIRSIIANCLVGDSIQVYDLRTMQKQPKPIKRLDGDVLSVMPNGKNSFYGICADSINATLFAYYKEGGWGPEPENWLRLSPNDTIKIIKLDGLRILEDLLKMHQLCFNKKILLLRKDFYQENKIGIQDLIIRLYDDKSALDFDDYNPTYVQKEELIKRDIDPDFGGPYITLYVKRMGEYSDINWNNILNALNIDAYSSHHALLKELIRENCFCYQLFFNKLEEKGERFESSLVKWKHELTIPCPYDAFPYNFVSQANIDDQMRCFRGLLSDLGYQVNSLECNPTPVGIIDGSDKCFGISSQGLITLTGDESSCNLTGSIRIIDQKGSLIHVSNSGSIIGYDIGQYCTVPGSYNVVITFKGSSSLTLVFIKH